MVKKLLVFGLAMGLAGASYGANLDEGTHELRLSGLLDPETALDTEARLEGGYGYFLADGVEIGFLAEYSDNDAATSAGGSLFLDVFYTAAGGMLVPYGGVQASVLSSETDFGGVDEDENALVGMAQAGGLFFVTDNLAVDAKGQYRMASEDIYIEDDDVVDTDIRFVMGLRYFFDLM